VEVEWQI